MKYIHNNAYISIWFSILPPDKQLYALAQLLSCPFFMFTSYKKDPKKYLENHKLPTFSYFFYLIELMDR